MTVIKFDEREFRKRDRLLHPELQKHWEDGYDEAIEMQLRGSNILFILYSIFIFILAFTVGYYVK